MEHQIEKARDEWIDEFKTGWDIQIKKLYIERETVIENLSKKENDKIKLLEHYRDQQIEYIQSQCLKDIGELKTIIDKKKNDVENKYSYKLSMFLRNNLNQPTIYDSVCSYILSFKSTIFSKQYMYNDGIISKPEEFQKELTFQNTTSINYTEPDHPLTIEEFVDVSNPSEYQHNDTIKKNMHNITNIQQENSVSMNPRTTKNQESINRDIKKQLGIAPLSNEQHITLP
jgi:hypothetical protein